MKADKYGTITEQKRHRMGWVRRVKTAGDAGKCKTCAHIDETTKWRSQPIIRAMKQTTTFRCEKGDFATTGSGGCNEYAPR